MYRRFPYVVTGLLVVLASVASGCSWEARAAEDPNAARFTDEDVFRQLHPHLPAGFTIGTIVEREPPLRPPAFDPDGEVGDRAQRIRFETAGPGGGALVLCIAGAPLRCGDGGPGVRARALPVHDHRFEDPTAVTSAVVSCDASVCAEDDLRRFVTLWDTNDRQS